MANTCIEATTRCAAELGYQVTLVRAATAAHMGEEAGLGSRSPVRIDALAGSAKRKQGPGLIASQSEIKNLKVVPHVSAVCRSGER